eukprot:7234387-Pyramimonas_sp.AAC.1
MLARAAARPSGRPESGLPGGESVLLRSRLQRRALRVHVALLWARAGWAPAVASRRLRRAPRLATGR